MKNTQIELKGYWSCHTLAQPIIHVTACENGDYYNLQCTVNSQGWLIEVIRNGTFRGSFQGSSFNLQIEIYKAIQKF